MAVEFKVDHTRTSEYLILPEDIKFNPELNGRHELPEIDWLIQSMVRHGQLQPVSIKNDGGIPWLHIGHSRWRAAIEINRKKLTPVPFKLRCVYFKGSELDAFRATIAENRDRNATTPIDDAHNCARFQRYGMTLEQIANEYHEDEKWVKDRLALVDLCEEAQKAVVNRTLKPNAAKALAKLSAEAQKSAIKSGEKLTPATIKRIAAPSLAPSTGKSPANAPAKRKWQQKDFCEIISRYLGSDLPKYILEMTAENAVRTVLGEISDEIECGQ